MNVLVLAGGTSNEREVSLRSGAAVAAAVRELGHACTEADPGSNEFKLRDAVAGIDVVFPALHGAGGEDGTLQTQLESIGVPFIGSDSTASKLCFDKWAYKKLLNDNGLPASDGKLVSAADLNDSFFKSPYVLKPNDGGSSLDTQIARQPGEVSLNESRELLSRYHRMLLEPLVPGTEITVGIFIDSPLPVIEIVPPEGKEFDYENKYNGESQELCPPQSVDEAIQHTAQELALKIHTLTGCRHFSRTDMIVDANNNLRVLETNTIPGLTSQSLLPKMIQQAGMSMPQFVDKLLQQTLSEAS